MKVERLDCEVVRIYFESRRLYDLERMIDSPHVHGPGLWGWGFLRVDNPEKFWYHIHRRSPA